MEQPGNGFSYQGQDRFVLGVLGGVRGGFFLDSGASDGVRGSNTKLLESSYGWTGICIEPNAALFAELVRNRSCVCVNCCLYDREGMVDFYESAGVYGGIVAEYDAGHLEFVRDTLETAAPPEGDAGIRPKPARTVGSLLREHHAPSVIDYWSLDTEGSELAILSSFPFDEYGFHVLTVEHNHTPAREAIHELLEAQEGYSRVCSLGIDDCYVATSQCPRLGWRSPVWAWTRSRRRGPTARQSPSRI